MRLRSCLQPRAHSIACRISGAHCSTFLLNACLSVAPGSAGGPSRLQVASCWRWCRRGGRRGCGQWRRGAQTTCSPAWCSTAPMGALHSTTGLVTTPNSTRTGAQPRTCLEGCVRAHWEHCLHAVCPEHTYVAYGGAAVQIVTGDLTSTWKQLAPCQAPAGTEVLNTPSAGIPLGGITSNITFAGEQSGEWTCSQCPWSQRVPSVLWST